MKRLFFVLILVAIFAGGCIQNDFTDIQENECTIRFSFGGEITSSEEPITKVFSSNDLLFLQIKRGNSNFACGVFDKLEDVRLLLKQGGDLYSVTACLIKNGKARLSGVFNSSLNAMNAGHSSAGTFRLTGAANSEWMYINSFWYNSVGRYLYYTSSNEGQTTTGSRTGLYFGNLSKGEIGGTSYPECTDLFYGEAGDFTASSANDVWNIDLKRVTFQLKYELSGVTDGNVDVTIKNSTRTFFSNNITTSSFESNTKCYAFSKTRDAWLYSNDYSEQFTVSVVWNRGIGITQNLGSTTIQIKRNCLNTIKIRLGSDDSNAGVSLSTEPESTIGTEGVTIPVQ
jgi:hypothetical protein